MRQSEGMMSLPIDDFIANAGKFLASDAPREAVPTLVDGVPVDHPRGDIGLLADAIVGSDLGVPSTGRMRLIECGLPADYLDTRIRFLLDLAVAGKAAGATLMIAG